MSKQERAVAIFFVTALFLYFYSESILRQAALSRLKSQKLSTEAILAKLPPSIRNSARRSLEIGKLKDAVREASDDNEKVRAMINLASAIENKREQEKLYREIIRLPQTPDASPAYSYFLLDSRPEFSISINDYAKFARNCPKQCRYAIWSNGLSTLESRKAQVSAIGDYISRLLSEPPPYRDYLALYDRISDFALRTGNMSMLEKSGRMSTLSLTKPPAIEGLAMRSDGKPKQ